MPESGRELNLSSLGIQLPYDMQAEQSVLGAAILDEESLNLAMQQITPEMFYSEQNRAVCAQMQTLYAHSDAVDIVTLVNALSNDKAFQGADDAKAYVLRLAETVPSISNFPSYLRIVRNKYRMRRLIQAMADVLSQSSEEEDASLVLESVEQHLFDIRKLDDSDSTGVKTLRDAVQDVIRTMQNLSGPDREKYTGIPTGYAYLDHLIGGLGRSDLIILAGRPGMGKTSFALNIASNVARTRRAPTIIFSLEMTCEQLTNSILSSAAGLDSRSLRTGQMNDTSWNDFADAANLISNFPIYLDDTSGISVPEIQARIRQINQDPNKEPIGLVIVDYLQLMQGRRRTENRVQEISEITRSLKIMAKDLNVPVLVLSQLSRAAEKSAGRTDRRPQLSDLRDSGSIEQDADVVLFLYRAAYYNAQNGEDAQSDEREAECIVAKNRHGETGTVYLGWDGPHTRFIDIDTAHDYS